MNLVLAALVFPALIFALSLGLGLLVERAGGASDPLPAGVRLPLGFAALVGLGQLLAGLKAPAEVAAPVIIGAAAVGGLLGLRHAKASRIRPTIEGALFGAVGLAFVVLAAPVILHGDVTSTGFLLDTTAAVQLQGATWIADHGADFAVGAGDASSAANYLAAYFGGAYPTGAHAVLGYLGAIVPVDLLWLYTPFLAVSLAIAASGFYAVARRFELSPMWSAAGATAAAVPAITYAYFLQGSIKEVVAVPVLVALSLAVLVVDPQVHRRRTSLLVLAVSAAAVVGVVGLSGLSWSLLAAAIWLPMALVAGPGTVRARARALAPMLGFGLGVALILALPTILDVRESLRLATALSQSNASLANDPGNLPQPIGALHGFGAWLSGDHRADPEDVSATYIFVAMTLVGLVLAVTTLVRQRSVSAVLWIAGLAAIWFVLTERGTMWTDAKLVVLASPWIVLFSVVGWQRLADRGLRIEAWVAGIAVLVGVLLSDARLYRNTGVMPTARYEELLDVADVIEGRGRTLLPDFDEYALYALRASAPSGFGFAHLGATTGIFRDGEPVGYGHSVDLDQVDPKVVRQFPVIVQRRGTHRSHPPSDYRRVFNGQYYTAWFRNGGAAPPSTPIGVSGRHDVASGPVSCRRATGIFDAAERRGMDVVAMTAPEVRRIAGLKTDRSGNWTRVHGEDEAAVIDGPGFLSTTFDLPSAGRWRLWITGGVARDVSIAVDGRKVATRGDEEGAPDNRIRPVEMRLDEGPHNIRIERGGGTFEPGDRRASLLWQLEMESADAPRLIDVVRPRELCASGSRWDWVELRPERQ